jgi:hypothetical protein
LDYVQYIICNEVCQSFDIRIGYIIGIDDHWLKSIKKRILNSLRLNRLQEENETTFDNSKYIKLHITILLAKMRFIEEAKKSKSFSVAIQFSTDLRFYI